MLVNVSISAFFADKEIWQRYFLPAPKPKMRPSWQTGCLNRGPRGQSHPLTDGWAKLPLAPHGAVPRFRMLAVATRVV